MLTIISTLIGFLGSGLPGILNFFTTRQNNNYQLELAKIQMQAAAQGAELKIEQATVEAEAKLQETLYSYDNAPTGTWVDVLRTSVRPVITYTFFGVWLFVEVVTFMFAIHQGKELVDVLPFIWNDMNQNIFCTIVAFWFGSRAIDKAGIFPPINRPKITATRK
jgi:hypothetical protein